MPPATPGEHAASPGHTRYAGRLSCEGGSQHTSSEIAADLSQRIKSSLASAPLAELQMWVVTCARASMTRVLHVTKNKITGSVLFHEQEHNPIFKIVTIGELLRR